MIYTFNVRKNHVFTLVGLPPLHFDIYRPDRREPSPIVLVIHGGGWHSRSGDMSSVCQRLAARGFLALNLTYRLAPKNRFPAALNDVQAALDYVRAHAKEFGGDPKNIFCWGYSAGGHLALLLGLNPKNQIRGIVSGGAPTDLTVYPRSPLVLGFLGKARDQDRKLWTDASPLFHVHSESPPVFMYHGTKDWLVGIEQMRRMKERLDLKKVAVKTKELKWLGHLGVYLFSRSSIEDGAQFLQKLII